MTVYLKSMSTGIPPGIRRMHSIIWTFIYGGLMTCVASYFVGQQYPGLATIMTGVGVVAVIVGIVLIYVRSQIKDTPKDAT